MTYTSPGQVPAGYQQNQYLDSVVTVPIPATAGPFDVVASMTVPIGQYWLPKFMRVSLKNSASGQATLMHSADYAGSPVCNVYYGPAQQSGAFSANTVPVATQGLYLDGTYRGDADESGVVSGMFLSSGNALTAVWHNLMPPLNNATGAPVVGGTAVFELIGQMSNVPLSVGTGLSLPETMGPGFRGKDPTLAIPSPAISGTATYFAVDAPGPGKSALLCENLPPYLQLHQLYWVWSGNEPTAAQVTGDFRIHQNHPAADVLILTADIAKATPRTLDLAGITTSSPGVGATGDTILEFVQNASSGIATGAQVLVGTLVYSSTDVQMP